MGHRYYSLKSNEAVKLRKKGKTMKIFDGDLLKSDATSFVIKPTVLARWAPVLFTNKNNFRKFTHNISNTVRK